MALCIRQVIDEDPPRIVVFSTKLFSNMKIGDNVQVTISGQTLSGPGGGMISIGQGGSMSVPGIIVQVTLQPEWC